ncbi:type II secretion system protein GspC [Paraferrimonas sp. SM1919]|uniref:type II secretion system protein GspC n=1 Tax=Paraferrimonas sp. SM1919 TaxID=2662263 RepID=UPI0013D2FA71|nr:type II secretion system protein GspC [Paraferrimonas sp. SM1919]
MEQVQAVISKLKTLPKEPVINAGVLLFATLALYQLAQLTWQVITPTQTSTTWKPVISVTEVEQVSIENIKKLQLFGEKGSAAVVEKKPQIVKNDLLDAPKTSLSIQLTGVVASTNESNGLAIIESAGSQETYSIGDKIKATRASLAEVFADRAIINNSGKLETVMLDGMTFTSAITDSNAQLQQAKIQEKSKVLPNSDVYKRIKESKEKLLQDPSSISNYFRFSKVTNKDGSVEGYRLNPGQDRDLFYDAGFKANDLAKSVNGYDLTDPMQAMELMGQLRELSEVSIIVERQGQLIDISLAAPQE